jgi:glycosyltransferase involved in cell wall biosynthesis
MSTGPMRVALYAGVYMRADAISTSVRYKLETLRRLADDGVPVLPTLFAHGSDCNDPAMLEVASVHEIARTEEFHAASAHIFEFGISYDLFDAMFIVPPGPVIVGVYHNVTPPELAHNFELRETLERSLTQRHNLFNAHRVLCDSEFNRDDLVRLGIPEERLSVLHLPPAIVPPPHQVSDEDTVELLYVGRFVQAKGVLDLVRAFAAVVRRGAPPVRLTLVGNPMFSSAQCMDDLAALVTAGGVGSVVHIVPSATQDALAALYARSDALVIPSYHEGYCMPVIEALLSQCHIIAYDAGNLPYIVDGLGTLVPTGDVGALSDAIAEFAERSHQARRQRSPMMVPTPDGPIPEGEWRSRVAAHLERHSAQAFEAGMVDLLRWAALRTGHDTVARALAERTLAEVG